VTTVHIGNDDAAPQPAPLALVAGASRGLGFLIARELGDLGHRLVICSRNRAELEQAAEDLRERGLAVQPEVCDVSDAASVVDLVERVEAEQGPVDVLVTVAGVIQVGPLRALERRHFTEAVDIMLWGPINTALAVMPRMRERGHGRIGVITSVGGLIAAPHLLPYSTAKFGAVGFSRGLRSELAGSGVTVTTVAPGLMRTGSHIRAKFVGKHPQEYAWFASAGSLPVVSMDAERAAARIVRAILSGRSELTVTPLAWMAPRVAALLPRLTAGALGLATRLLPSSPEPPDSTTIEGWDAARRLSPTAARLVGRLTTLSDAASRRFNERPTSERHPVP
jgi:NAD(P)-dependent dehydrogenase (short-subunit alcohol dehydrogenase family)